MPRVLEDAAEQDGRQRWARDLAAHLERSDSNRQRLARAIGVSRAQLDKYANGVVTVPGKYLGRIADHLGFDVYDQLASLGWLGEQGAEHARGQRLHRSWQGVHDEVQRLVAADAEMAAARPASSVVDMLVQEGWLVRHWMDWRGERRRVGYLDVLELTPPLGSEGVLGQADPLADGSLSAVDRAARAGLTPEEMRWRDEAEAAIGPSLLHRHECYWSERERHASIYRGRPPADSPGLVLAVPWLLRRRHPRETAAVLRPVRSTGAPDFAPTSLLVLGLPYSGAPDVACLLADEVLHWGTAGVALLARERWQSASREDRDDREARTAASIAAGDDLRTRRTVWFFNEPRAIEAAAPLLADGPAPPAIIHLRLTDASVDEFLVPEWGGVQGRSRADILHWRNLCDQAVNRHVEVGRGDDVLTLDVHLRGEFRGTAGEDARSDLYTAELARRAERWIGERFNARREPIRPDELELVRHLASAPRAVTIDGCAAALGLSVPATRLLIERVMTHQGISSRRDLAAFAAWRAEATEGEE